MTEQTVSREEFDRLQAFAGEQSRRAERLSLMAEFDLSAEELAGPYASPEAMRQHAELVSMRKEIAVLRERPVVPAAAAPPVGDAPPEAPPGDLGGPTAPAPSTFQQLDVEYERIKKMGPSQQARRLMLQNIYRDKRRTSRVRPGHEE